MSIRLRRSKFQVRVTVNGRTASKSFDTEAEAQRWEVQQKVLLGHGIVEQSKPASELPELTLGEAITRYSAEILPGKRGQQSERYLLRYWHGSALTTRTVNEISRQDLVAERDKLLRASLAPSSVRRYLDCLSAVLTACARDWLLLDTNPMSEIRKPPNGKPRERRVSQQELNYILHAARFAPDLRAIIRIALETGMRRSEILGMEWRHIDLERRVVWLPLTKNGDSRTVPLSLDAVKTLEALPRRTDGKLFSKNGTSLSGAFQRAVRRARQAYELEAKEHGRSAHELVSDPLLRNLRFHDLRHERISSLVEGGFNLIEVAAISGHRTMQCLKRYSHLQTATLIDKLDRISPPSTATTSTPSGRDAGEQATLAVTGIGLSRSPDLRGSGGKASDNA
ncbi:tyrosine-type recombinase/integrase [Burkholderia sp. COPS]|uniref:tyrosine-type recombinase/integrase n=1 Tax=Burkholderia sp. COPS TaxID=2597663 RepID=UPI001C664B61|nr:site-specific integrase [Burkholderia sp. COPS]MBW5805868.1 tyrosine-type recombinase/integrase [Burkholderia sp. COPS]